MKIFFENGVLLIETLIPHSVAINARFGVEDNLRTLERVNRENPHAVVYTNQILALDNTYAWNNELGVSEIYLRRGDEFVRIDKLTDRELHRAHNIMKMYLSGAFNEEATDER